MAVEPVPAAEPAPAVAEPAAVEPAAEAALPPKKRGRKEPTPAVEPAAEPPKLSLAEMATAAARAAREEAAPPPEDVDSDDEPIGLVAGSSPACVSTFWTIYAILFQPDARFGQYTQYFFNLMRIWANIRYAFSTLC